MGFPSQFLMAIHKSLVIVLIVNLTQYRITREEELRHCRDQVDLVHACEGFFFSLWLDY